MFRQNNCISWSVEYQNIWIPLPQALEISQSDKQSETEPDRMIPDDNGGRMIRGIVCTEMLSCDTTYHVIQYGRNGSPHSLHRSQNDVDSVYLWYVDFVWFYFNK